MANFIEAVRLRTYMGENDMRGTQPLYRAIVAAARDAGLSGATVTRGIVGFGRSAHVHEVYRGFSNDLPIIVEVVDREGRIMQWLPILDALLNGEPVTIEPVRLLDRGDAAS